MAFYDEFKKVRNKMMYYNRYEIFAACMHWLAQIWNMHLYDTLNQKLPAPMYVLIMLKWGLLYGEYPSQARKKFDQAAFNDLYDDIKDLSVLGGLLDRRDPLGLSKWQRATMSHQKHYQLRSGIHGLALLETLLNRIGVDYDIDRTMLEICNLTVREFIDLQVVILHSMVLSQSYKSYRLDYYKFLFFQYGKEKVRAFLNFMSADMVELISFLQVDHERIGNPEFEFALLSPLFRKPLFRDKRHYAPYHVALIQENVEFGVYDLLKEKDGANFCSPFGYSFEEYVASALVKAQIEFTREKGIRKITRKDCTCDFLVIEENSMVLLEAKSAEMHYLTRHDPKPHYIEKTLKNSVVSAYKQIFRTAEYLIKAGYDNADQKDFFGVVITFKDLLLGHPFEIWAEFMRDIAAKEFGASNMENLPVQPEKIFVISSYGFDHLIAYATRKRVPLSHCLRKVVERNRTPGQRKFFFHDNFDDEQIRILEAPLLREAFESIMERAGEALIKGQFQFQNRP